MGNKINAEHDGKVGCNTNWSIFVYSDWMYFLWHGITIVSLTLSRTSLLQVKMKFLCLLILNIHRS